METFHTGTVDGVKILDSEVKILFSLIKTENFPW